MKRFLLAFLFFFFFVSSAFAANYPQYQNYVNDFANVISPQTEEQLNKKLADFDKQTTNQIAVVTVKTTEPEALEDYSIHLTDEWKIGQKGKDNGVLMLFAMDDRKMRIEVGRGLEGELTDLQSKRILDNVIRPAFRSDNYDKGITDGVDAVIKTITDPTATTSANTAEPLSTMDVIIIVIMIIIIIAIIIAISPVTPLGGAGTWGPTAVWSAGKSNDSDNDSFGGFGGGGFSGGGSSSNW